MAAAVRFKLNKGTAMQISEHELGRLSGQVDAVESHTLSIVSMVAQLKQCVRINQSQLTQMNMEIQQLVSCTGGVVQ